MLNALRLSRCLWILPISIVLLCSGCGDPDIIVTDSAAESGDSIVIDETTGNTISTESTKDKGIGGWWGVRQVKGVFTDSDTTIDPNYDESLPFAETQEDTPINPDEVWTSEDEVITEEDYKRATELVKSQNFVEAKNILLDIISRHPESSSAWRWLGDCYYNLLELPESINAYAKARELYPENYFAMRGEGFAHLHYGNELWRLGERRNAHDQYRKALRTLQDCMRIYPGDLEALYGRSMAAEGASRRLYQNAITLLRQNRQQEAESEAKICVEVIDEGIESARQRLLKKNNELGPIIITGGLFQRRAILLKSFKRYANAAEDMSKAIEAYDAVLKLAPGNNLATTELEKCQRYLEEIDTILENEPMTF